ncbi:hypothetical protein EMPG_16380 [Blastomyces silverae]|uniref:Uncharacterized protein n=1 Tax=Blastomyces silverae TaxID=2060906 RepID=A0A0H1BG42_9EURO|nr:hypothetical protein EMPG_16380 [Blastomyces silverae]
MAPNLRPRSNYRRGRRPTAKIPLPRLPRDPRRIPLSALSRPQGRFLPLPHPPRPRRHLQRHRHLRPQTRCGLAPQKRRPLHHRPDHRH